MQLELNKFTLLKDITTIKHFHCTAININTNDSIYFTVCMYTSDCAANTAWMNF